MKSNIEYLREEIAILNINGSGDVAIEFLDAVEAEFKNATTKTTDTDGERDDEDAEDDDSIENNFPIHTLQDQQLLDAFNKFVDQVGPLQAERILDRMNKEPYLQAAK